MLFVCIGNICRSPMAEGLMRQVMPQMEICSAGLHALVGQPADPLSVRLMEERGIDIRSHRAQNLANWMLNEADLILTMDREQTRYIEQCFPAAKGRVLRLGEFANFDIPDPYQQGAQAFRHASGLIAKGVDAVAGHIAEIQPVLSTAHAAKIVSASREYHAAGTGQAAPIASPP